jgi:hypothetical protein
MKTPTIWQPAISASSKQDGSSEPDSNEPICDERRSSQTCADEVEGRQGKALDSSAPEPAHRTLL